VAHGIIHCPLAPSMEISFSAEGFSIHLKHRLPISEKLGKFCCPKLDFPIEFATSQLSFCDELRD
jgi:hypothetical protein